MRHAIRSNLFVVILSIIPGTVVIIEIIKSNNSNGNQFSFTKSIDTTWSAPSLYLDQITKGREREMVIYGEELIANTSTYLGPHGSVAQITNGMNCQNCHLDAGTRPWGNNYGGVYSTYPKLRARSGTVENIFKRVNDCFERSLNGQALDTNSYEMQSIYAYMKWLGKEVPKGHKAYSSGLPGLPFMNRAANPQKGKIVYNNVCLSCHGENGEGILTNDEKTFTYPPLWGKQSYNDGAGLYRLSRFASFVRNNMPFNKASHTNPTLTDEEAWDVAAFVNSQPRPHIDQRNDWPDFSKKSIDEPFGPYSDGFTALQHKYGPFVPIEEARKKQSQNKNTAQNKL